VIIAGNPGSAVGTDVMNDHDFTKKAELSEAACHGNHSLHGPAEYLRQIRASLQAGRQSEAFELVQLSLVQYPDDPVFLSYYGCLLVLVERMYRRGVETCQTAIKKFQATGSYDDEKMYAVFYHNLGRAFAASAKRNDAREVLKIGLSYDPGNYDIVKELRRLGTRTIKPPIPFLQRSNPLNKYIGMMLYKKKNASIAKKKVTTR